MKTNIAKKVPKAAPITTAEGAPATPTPNAAAALRRAIMSCLLWEDEFYESGVTIAERIKLLVPQVPAEVAAEFAWRAREDMKLRHAPLLVAREMARGPRSHRLLVSKTLERIIQRADELTEFLAIYWKDGKQPLSAQVKKGLAKAFPKFNEYALAKYNRDGPVKLRDVLFLSHAKPKDATGRWTKADRKAMADALETDGFVGRLPPSPGEQLFLRVVDNKLETPDTWEAELSGGADKGETFARLIAEDKLGALALLRNLRNMYESKVDPGLIKMALEKMDVKWVLPHRFIAAARFVPQWESWVEPKMLECAAAMPKLKGKTVLVVDVSGSMDYALSHKSDLRRVDAACGLAIIAREVCEEVEVLTFSHMTVRVPDRRGFALRDAILKSQPHGSTYLGAAVAQANAITCDRIIVITDEQSHDAVGAPLRGIKGYMINVASNKNGVGYGAWNKIDGFSESVIRYIAEYESTEEK